MDYEPNGVLNTQADPGGGHALQPGGGAVGAGRHFAGASCLSTVVDILPRPEYFYAVNNRLIYGAMVEMFALGQPVDFVTVLERLKEEKDFDEATGKVYLTQLAQLVPAISHVESYAKIVRDKYDLRTLMQPPGTSSATPARGSRTPLCCWIPPSSAFTISAGARAPRACSPCGRSCWRPLTGWTSSTPWTRKSTGACPRASRSWTTPSPA